MALPIAQIIAAAAPLVMSAVELYRRRNEAKAAGGGAAGGSDALQRRLRELEETDLEQTRLIAELSRSVEALARMMESTQAESRRKDTKIKRLLGFVIGFAAISVALSIWAVVKA